MVLQQWSGLTARLEDSLLLGDILFPEPRYSRRYEPGIYECNDEVVEELRNGPKPPPHSSQSLFTLIADREGTGQTLTLAST